MPYEPITNTWTLDDKMQQLMNEKKAALQIRDHKLVNWDDNYLLYRNKVKTNRLTQRQAVNIPLMKETIKTILSRIDEMSEIDWKELGGDEQKQLVYQEVWNNEVQEDKYELLDVLDKKNVLLYGISATYLNIDEDGVCMSVLDPYDIAYDPLMRPNDVDSARFIVITNIFRSVKEVLADNRYSEEAKNQIKIWATTPKGIVQSAQNLKTWQEKEERLKTMGVSSSDFNLFAGGDAILNLTQHFTMQWENDKWVRHVVTYAQDTIELLDKTLQELIGVNDFWPLVVWSEDPETNDIYPDSIGDLVRVPNKVLNVWFSQLIENRTLKNFQMHWFLPLQGYTPQTYTPGAGVMLPAPPGDDINKVIKPVEIDGLDDTLEAIAAVTSIVERASGATALEKGTAEQGTQTLGEIKILVGKANERTTSMAKFYRMAWYERACKWNRLMHANPPRSMNLHKIGRDGKAYPKKVPKSEWYSQDGYKPVIRSESEQELENTKTIQRFMFILGQFPNNEPLKKIAQKRMLQLVDLTPEELRQVEEGEKAPPPAAPGIAPGATPSPYATQPNTAAPGAPAPAAPGAAPAAGSSPADMEELRSLLGQAMQ